MYINLECPKCKAIIQEYIETREEADLHECIECFHTFEWIVIDYTKITYNKDI